MIYQLHALFNDSSLIQYGFHACLLLLKNKNINKKHFLLFRFPFIFLSNSAFPYSYPTFSHISFQLCLPYSYPTFFSRFFPTLPYLLLFYSLISHFAFPTLIFSSSFPALPYLLTIHFQICHSYANFFTFPFQLYIPKSSCIFVSSALCLPISPCILVSSQLCLFIPSFTLVSSELCLPLFSFILVCSQLCLLTFTVLSS